MLLGSPGTEGAASQRLRRPACFRIPCNDPRGSQSPATRSRVVRPRPRATIAPARKDHAKRGSAKHRPIKTTQGTQGSGRHGFAERVAQRSRHRPEKMTESACLSSYSNSQRPSTGRPSCNAPPRAARHKPPSPATRRTKRGPTWHTRLRGCIDRTCVPDPVTHLFLFKPKCCNMAPP